MVEPLRPAHPRDELRKRDHALVRRGFDGRPVEPEVDRKPHADVRL